MTLALETQHRPEFVIGSLRNTTHVCFPLLEIKADGALLRLIALGGERYVCTRGSLVSIFLNGTLIDPKCPTKPGFYTSYQLARDNPNLSRTELANVYNDNIHAKLKPGDRITIEEYEIEYFEPIRPAPQIDWKWPSFSGSFRPLPYLVSLLLITGLTGVAELVRNSWPWLSTVVYSVMAAAAIIPILRQRNIRAVFHGFRIPAPDIVRLGVGAMMLAPAAIISFSQICRTINASYPEMFVATSDNFWYWIRFGLHNSFEGILLDIPSVYSWGITDLRTNDFLASTLTLGYRLYFELGILAAILPFVILKISERKGWAHLRYLQPPFTERLVRIIVAALVFTLWASPLGILVAGVVAQSQIEPPILFVTALSFLSVVLGAATLSILASVMNGFLTVQYSVNSVFQKLTLTAVVATALLLTWLAFDTAVALMN